MNSFIPWVGGKGKLLWIINKLMPDRYTRFIDVFGGSGTVTMCRPIQRGCMEVYITEWDESAVRQLVETVKILSKDEVAVTLKGGIELCQKIMY